MTVHHPIVLKTDLRWTLTDINNMFHIFQKFSLKTVCIRYRLAKGQDQKLFLVYDFVYAKMKILSFKTPLKSHEGFP